MKAVFFDLDDTLLWDAKKRQNNIQGNMFTSGKKIWP